MRFPWRLIPAAGLGLLVAACGTPITERLGDRDGERFAYRGGEIAFAQRGGECQLTLSGEINPATVSSLSLATTDLAKRACRSKVLVLDAGDGAIGAAITLGSMVRNRGFDTRLKPGSSCLTPCMLVFAAGAERELPAGSPPPRLAFSRIPPDEDFGKTGCDSELDNRQLLNLARYLRAMLPGPAADFTLQRIRSADCRGARDLPAREAVSAGLATKG